jgi:hypothetical protein
LSKIRHWSCDVHKNQIRGKGAVNHNCTLRCLQVCHATCFGFDQTPSSAFYNARWWLWNKAETCCTIHSKTMQSTSVTYCHSPPFFACVSQLDVTRNDCAYRDLPKSSSRFINYFRTDKYISRGRNTGLWNQLSWRSKI